MTYKLEHIPEFSYLHLCTFIKTAYIWCFLRAVPAHNAIYEIFLTYSHSNFFQTLHLFTCCLVGGGISFWNYLKFTKMFISIFILHACPAFLKHSLKKLFFMQIWKNFCLRKSDKEYLKITETKRIISKISINILR